MYVKIVTNVPLLTIVENQVMGNSQLCGFYLVSWLGSVDLSNTRSTNMLHAKQFAFIERKLFRVFEKVSKEGKGLHQYCPANSYFSTPSVAR